MSHSSKNHFPSEKVVQVMVDSILRKNGVKREELKSNISEEQKQMLKEMVEDLRKQVEAFQQSNRTDEDSDELRD
ncbi:hypothetical protein GCM10010978_07320 [Compostibacillus humi]|uniref:Spore coat protein W n=1 Tax=Compostibacillus humi TaxID=1245525 RepID=A0A8J3EJ54_9BACI|nr:spore coat protein [Compostibacillus humi]GGH71416.1 hypothetical protein GCM10010978_07320 [Compostibacillus humi]